MKWTFTLNEAHRLEGGSLYQAVAEVEGDLEGYVGSDWLTKPEAEEFLAELKRELG